MTERPLILAAPDVLALLAGTKTQHRIPMARQPRPGAVAELYPDSITAHVFTPAKPHPNPIGGTAPMQSHWSEHCPLGRDGDRVWIREAWRIVEDGGTPDRGGNTYCRIEYLADGATQDFQTQRLYAASDRRQRTERLPRWAARLVLEVTDVRVERLQRITERDATAEGFNPITRDCKVPKFRERWEGIHGAGTWAANPWVWVIGLRRTDHG